MNFSNKTFYWNTITEQDWNEYLPERFSCAGSRIVRVFPDSPLYSSVVALRYAGLVRSGYLDPARHDPSCMRLARDTDSIIAALLVNDEVAVSLTFNTPTQRFPRLAMELEKGIVLDHSRFRDPNVIEFVKLVAVPHVRPFRYGVNLFLLGCLLGIMFSKPHFWHVSRTVGPAMAFMRKFGFTYSDSHAFVDAGLNNTKSCAGYCSLDSICCSEAVPNDLRRCVQEMMERNLETEDRRAVSQEEYVAVA
jgi:hypothetical protein